MTRLVRNTTFVGAAAAAIACFSRPAHGSGFAAARFGGEHGTVVTTNPTALYYNPAGIAFSTGTHLFLDGSLAMRHATWQHALAPTDRPDPPGAEGANTGEAKLFNVFGGPMLGATTRIGNFAFGASLTVPFGGRASWSQNDKFKASTQFPLAADGVQRWHGIDGALTFIYLTAGAAYRLGPLSIGVTGNLIRSSIQSTQAKKVVGNGDPDTANEGRASLDVSGIQGSFGVGAMLEAIPDHLWLGASYQAQPGLGPMTLKGSLDITYQGSELPLRVTFDQALPDIVRLGGRFRPNDSLELRLAGDLTRWSVMGSQCVVIEGHKCAVDATGADASGEGGTVQQNLRRHWKDTYGVRAGASFWLKPEVELFAGIGFETAAVPDETMDPALADADNVSPAVGGRFEIFDAFYLATSYTHIQYMNRDNTGKSEIASGELPTRRPDGGGKYTQWVGVFNVNIEKQF